MMFESKEVKVHFSSSCSWLRICPKEENCFCVTGFYDPQALCYEHLKNGQAVKSTFCTLFSFVVQPKQKQNISSEFSFWKKLSSWRPFLNDLSFVALKTRNFRVLSFWDIILQNKLNNTSQSNHRTVTEKEQSLIIISRWAIFGIYKCIHHNINTINIY